MTAKSETLQSAFDSAFAGIGQTRKVFAPQLAPREVGTITSIATGVANLIRRFL